MLSFLKKETSKTGEKKPIWILFAIGAIGIALILFGGASQAEKSEAKVESQTTVEEELTHYQEYLEARVESICKTMGAGDVEAIVTLESGFEGVFASQIENGKEEYVIVGSGSNAHPLLLYSNAPEIMGIGVVCKQPIPEARRNELLNLLSTSFHTPTNRIYVTSVK